MIAVGQHQQVRRGTMHHVEGVEHFAQRQQIEIGSAQTAGGDAGPGQERGFEPRGGGHLRGQPIPDGGHDDEAGLGKQGAQTIRGGHGVSSCGFVRRHDRGNAVRVQGRGGSQQGDRIWPALICPQPPCQASHASSPPASHSASWPALCRPSDQARANRTWDSACPDAGVPREMAGTRPAMTQRGPVMTLSRPAMKLSTPARIQMRSPRGLRAWRASACVTKRRSHPDRCR